MHTREQLLYKLRWSPNLLSLASQAVEGQAMLYNGFTAVKGARGGGMFDLHQDNMYTRHDNGARTGPRTADGNSDGLGSCGIWVALHDLLTPESGPLLVAVGSHKTGARASPCECYEVEPQSSSSVSNKCHVFCGWPRDQPWFAYWKRHVLLRGLPDQPFTDIGR
jgi:ectoine hydroxylase-related dioxygenase (phytanoyl-CoA dioxygenase family)